MTNATSKYDVHDAINDVMRQVGYVQKERVSGLNYSFAGEAALIQALRPAMVEHGLYIHPTGVTMVASEAYTTKGGTDMNRFVGAFGFRFTHAPSGTSVDVMCLGEGADPGDKACNKAMTSAYKYALRQTFCIETGDDPDRFNSDDMERDYTPISSIKPQAPVQDDSIENQTPTDDEFPPDDLLMSELQGRDLYLIARNAPVQLGLTGQGRHFEHRWQKRYGVRALNQIPGTVGNFMETMKEDNFDYARLKGEASVEDTY